MAPDWRCVPVTNEMRGWFLQNSHRSPLVPQRSQSIFDARDTGHGEAIAT